MSIRAKVSTFSTRPYEPGDLVQMDEEERKKFASGFYEKVLSEEVIEEFESDCVESLGERIAKIAEANQPRPVILESGNADELPFKHSFLIRRSYVPDDEKRLFELIVYSPKNLAAWKKKLDEAMERSRQMRKPTPVEQVEFMQKAVKRMTGEIEKTIMSAISKPPEWLGFASWEEYMAFHTENKKRFATEEEFDEFYKAEMNRRQEKARAVRREELVSKPPYYAAEMAKTLNDEMTVLCRIIGKDEGLAYKHFEYLKSFHKLSKYVYSITNEADDGSHVSFVYGDNLEQT